MINYQLHCHAATLGECETQHSSHVANSIAPQPVVLRCANYLSYALTAEHCLMHFTQPVQCLSSAVLHGGRRTIQQCLNWRVPITEDDLAAKGLTPEESLLDYYGYLDKVGVISPNRVIPASQRIGLMTAASMLSLRVCEATFALTHSAGNAEQLHILVAVTSGLDNARTAGEASDERLFAEKGYQAGTINMLMYSSKALTEAAMVEAHMMIAEAKAHTLHQHNIVSAGAAATLATGTGTDSTAVCCAKPQQQLMAADAPIEYVGKHTLYGEALAQCVMRALSKSITQTQ